MDGIVMLREDHKKVEALFKKLEKDEDVQVVPQICAMLTEHAYIEEQVFYPAVRAEVDGTLDEILEAVEEHHVVKVLIAELEKLTSDDDTYKAKATVLMELVRHHVEEEEGEMFPKVRDALGRRRLVEIGESMQAARATAPAA